MQDVVPGPIIENKPARDEINFEEPKIVQKPLNPDENALDKQINKIKAKNAKPSAEDPRGTTANNGTNIKSALRKSLAEREGGAQNGDAKQGHKSTTTQKEELKENPVEFSKTNNKKLGQASPSSAADEESPLNRKRKIEDGASNGAVLASLRKDLSQSVVPVSKRPMKRRKQDDAIKDNVDISMGRARKRRHRHKRRTNGEANDVQSDSDASEQSSSSADSISSTERDDLLRKYFKKILCPILQEEREQNKKDTMDLLEEKGLIELASKKDLINFDNLKRDEPGKDPFLEDSGFIPSDVSGATTPRKASSNVTPNKGAEKRDSFKLARTSQSQERKSLGTPKRRCSTTQIQKQIIMPNEITEITQVSKIEAKKIPNESVADTEPKSVITVTKKDEEGDKVAITKKTLFTSAPAPSSSLFGAGANKMSTGSIFNKPKETQGSAQSQKEEKKEEKPAEKDDKPKIKSIFGANQSTIEELARSRGSNNSSPSFGESKNTSKEDDSTTSEKSQPVKKTTSLFTPKEAVIPEAPNEDEPASQEEKPKPAAKVSLFGAGGFGAKKPEEKPASQEQPESKAANPFLMGASGEQQRPKNLFGQGTGSSQDKPKTSLFGNVAPAKGGIFGNKGNSNTPDSVVIEINNPKRNLFGSPNVSIALSHQSIVSKCFEDIAKPFQGSVAAKPPALAPQGNNNEMDNDDVGMGGTTPPTQSPIQQPAQPAKVFFNQGSSGSGGGSIFGNQGSGASLSSGGSGGSIFAKASMPSTGTTTAFSMGKSTTKPLFGATSGSIFASGPSQGQPEPSKPSWSSNPFGSKNKRNKDDDDGLFSDTKR